MARNSRGHDQSFKDHDQTKPTSFIHSFGHETYCKVDLDWGVVFLIKIN